LLTRNLSDVEKLPIQIRALKVAQLAELAELLASLFNYLGGPIEFDELVSARGCDSGNQRSAD
jgi:hypothetical protein